MSTDKTQEKPQSAVASSDLLAALARLKARLGQYDLPFVELFADGSGRLIVRGVKWAEFEGLQDAVSKIEAAANDPAQRPAKDV